MSWHDKNIEVYNRAAPELAAYFSGIGPRVAHINRAYDLAGVTENARVVEIGCGDGRDAEVITKRSAWYEGVDPSSGLLAIARRRLPDASFVEADAMSYSYPKNIDFIFAFASLLHVPKNDLQEVFALGAQALKPQGIYYLSVKERPEYIEEIKADSYGERMFYYYTPELLRELAGAAFRQVYEEHETIGSTKWVTIALQKYS